MERYLIDTDVLIDHLRGYKETLDFFEKSIAEGGSFHFSVISRAEIVAGLRAGEEEAVAQLFGSMAEIPVDGETADVAGKYRQRFRASHGLTLPDALVVATARMIDAVLITLNKRHYPMADVSIHVPYVKRG